MKFRTLLTVLFLSQWGWLSVDSAESAPLPPEVNSVVTKYCGECHNKEEREGDVDFTSFAQREQKERLDLLNKMQEQLHFQTMPPADAAQPAEPQRQLLVDWVRGELKKLNAPLIEDKLRYPDYGNAVDHEQLFSGTITDKPFTPARRWLVSPQIFMGRIIEIFRTPNEPHDKFMNWPGSKSLYGITNPFVLPEHSGIRDYAITPLDGGHLLVMLNNAQWISHKQIRSARVKKGDFKADEFENQSDRFSPPTHPAFEAVILNPGTPDEQALTAAIQAQFQLVLQRRPSDEELAKYLELMRSAVALGGNTEGLRQMLVAVLLESEFLYRQEWGEGEPDAYGRRPLSPREASYAISYALGDWGPDPLLAQAAATGRLNTKADYEREVRRLLAEQQYYRGQIDKTVNDSTIVSHPKIIRFFREFFGYPAALKVFKDRNRSNGYYENPGRGDTKTPGRLVREADMLVAFHVERDQQVLEQLLGTEAFFAAPMDYSGEKKGKEKQVPTVADKVRALNQIYEILKDYDWKKKAKQVPTDKPEAIALIRAHLQWNGGDEKSIIQIMSHVTAFREQGLDPHPQWNYPFGIHMLTPHVQSYNIHPPAWKYPASQPFPIEHRRGLLTHPAWLIAHSSNFHTDPIRRGRWIQEKLLAGRVPDVPITVDAKVPEDPHKTFRERVESVTGVEQGACWKCHQHMNPLGYAFECFDDFGRYRLEEPLESPENLVAKAKGKYDADTYKTKTVSTTGYLRGTGNAQLDGPVTDAHDLIDRLGKSDRVRQSIIRHAFRFFLGRNEMLSDSQTLIAADQAYLASDGSFQAVIVSLLTSDSFIYRK